jgi:hypothetical protein
MPVRCICKVKRPNTLHHQRPYTCCMSVTLKGRRMHAVLRLLPFGYSKIYNARQKGILKLVTCPIMLLINYPDRIAYR